MDTNSPEFKAKIAFLKQNPKYMAAFTAWRDSRPTTDCSQKYKVFFQEGAEPSHEEKLWKINRENPNSPFSKFIGNDEAIRKLQTAAYTALSDPQHKMRELAFSIFGPASAGKTTIVRQYAACVELPLVEISPKSVKTLDDIFNQIESVFRKTETPLMFDIDIEDCEKYVLPPCVIFIDEVHALSNSLIQGLLKATEYNDAILATESNIVVDTKNVTWMIATTDEGKLFDAFRTRFSPLVLKYLSKKDIAKIVKIAHPDLSGEICFLIAHYNSRIPRKALEFARYLKMRSGMEKDISLTELVKKVAKDEGINESGMNEVHVKILRALNKGPVAKNRISLVSGRKEEETENFIMPWLLTETEDSPALVAVGPKGYIITEAGKTALRNCTL